MVTLRSLRKELIMPRFGDEGGYDADWSRYPSFGKDDDED